MGNMLAACPACNMKKANKPLSECVRVWAPDLDSAAANASHLNSAARGCFLNALKIKHDLYHNHGTAPQFLEFFDLEIYLEELEDQLVWFYFRLTGYTVQGMNLVTFSREGE